jgi:nicotinate-nucleotide--dimethylbenzimidazole phosphoribosyltransferase
MGIGNTTAASCITAAFTSLPAAAVTGRGTERVAREARAQGRIVERALDLHTPDPADPIECWRRWAASDRRAAGAILGAAALRIPILDGFITNTPR